MNKLYSDLANWWPLLSPPEEYADEAAFFERILADAKLPARPSLLELGCGGGSNTFYLKKIFAELMLTDISPQMLEVSRGLTPSVNISRQTCVQQKLGRQFDVVFIHDAIDYMLTSADLRLAMETAFVHCKPGGMALFVPDNVRGPSSPPQTTAAATALTAACAISNGRMTRMTQTRSTPRNTSTCCAKATHPTLRTSGARCAYLRTVPPRRMAAPVTGHRLPNADHSRWI